MRVACSRAARTVEKPPRCFRYCCQLCPHLRRLTSVERQFSIRVVKLPITSRTSSSVMFSRIDGPKCGFGGMRRVGAVAAPGTARLRLFLGCGPDTFERSGEKPAGDVTPARSPGGAFASAHSASRRNVIMERARVSSICFSEANCFCSLTWAVARRPVKSSRRPDRIFGKRRDSFSGTVG